MCLNLRIWSENIRISDFMYTAYHVNEHRGTIQIVYAKGKKQWLGSAFYFWQDFEFAKEWVSVKKYNKTDIYTVQLELDFQTDENLIDTVFNEQHYYEFVKTIESFADYFVRKSNFKPSLEDFTEFIYKFGIWKEIKAIRFQDLPQNDKKDYLKVKNFFYKKRIQIALYDKELISTFTIITL